MNGPYASGHVALVTILLLLVPAGRTLAQENKGLPFITNYRYQDYNADGVNWWAAEDDNGVMYFANNNGILVFDGQHWEVVIPNEFTETRCVVKGYDGRIYAGTYGDIGYVGTEANGKLKFISLKEKLPEKYRQFSEVWECVKWGQKIIFRANNYLFILEGDKFKVIATHEDLHVGALIRDNYYVRVWNRGLTILKGDSLHLVPDGGRFANERIYAMLPFDEKRILIGTRTQGLFLYDGVKFTPFKTEADRYLINTSLYGGTVLPDGNFAINSFNDGMVIIDKQGRLIQRIDKSVGLQDNSVDHLFVDSRGMLWMPLFNGIAKLDLRSSLSFYDESTGLPAKTVFATGYNDGNLYAGTNNGVYILDNATNRFHKVSGTSGQIGSFLRNDKDYLVGAAENGLLKIVGAKTYPVITGINYDFHVQELVPSKHDSTAIYVIMRSGTAIVRYDASKISGNKYTVESYSDLVTTPGGLVERADGSIWVYDAQKGELNLIAPDPVSGKIDLRTASRKAFHKGDGLPGRPVGIYVDENQRILFASEKDSIFVFDEKQSRFVRDTTTLLGKYGQNIKDGTFQFTTDVLDRKWANFGNGVFVRYINEAGEEKIVSAPFRELRKNYGVWSIFATAGEDNQPVIWFSGREGVIRYDGNLEENKDEDFRAIIRGVNLNEDSVFFSGFTIPSETSTFPNNLNTVRIVYAAPFFKQENETVFSTWLEGRDKVWSEWTKQDFKEFGNLSAGHYVFHVKARNIYDTESGAATFSFSILSPWYASWWAYTIYGLLAIVTVYSIVRWRTNQLKEKHRELEKVVEERTAELKQRAEELAVINSVQEGLVKELDMQSIYNLVGEKIRDLFDAQAVVICTLDEKEGLEHFMYAIENGQRFYPEPRPYDKLRQYLIDTKEKIVINEKFAEAYGKFGLKTVPGTKTTKSGVYFPLFIGDRVNSYISLQNVDHENSFSESDIRLLDTLCNSMSVALENARLFDETNRLLKETEQRTTELGVINSVQEGLVREMNIKAIYDLVGDRICNLFDTQTVIIRTFDHDTGLENWQYAVELGKRIYSETRPFIWANHQLIQNRKPLLINENYLETAKKYGGAGVSLGLPPKSALFVPMVVGDVVKGSVSLQNIEKEQAFTESDQRLLTTLTNSMSVALENARLFDESNRLLDDAKQRANELSTVNNISQALTSQLNLEDLINLVGEQMKKLFNANIVYLAILDDKTRTINFPYQYGDDMQPMVLGEGLTSKIILTGEPLLINKDLDELRVQLGVKKIGAAAASYIGVPIPVGEEVIGVLSVQSTEHENRFNEDDLRLLTTIAASVGIALRKAKLFEEVKVARLEAEAARKTAERANEAKSSFLSTVSHELRTPLTSVLGFAKIIKKRLEEKIFPAIDRSDAKIEKTIRQVSDNLDVVVSEGERLTHLINDVLDLAKIEAGKMEWNMEVIDIGEIADRAIAATTSLFDQNNLILKKNIQPGIPDISGDRDKLIQVMVNLISNAVKFTPKGSVTCSIYQKADEVLFSIADTGIGIDPKDHAAVFEQFKQVGDTLTDKPKGTGLGLPICMEIIEHHGGRIWLESELGKGSTFFFALPVSKVIEPRAIHLNDLVKQLKLQVANSQLNIKDKAASLLVVDDDDSIRSLLQQELSEAGYRVEEARNGKEAVACARANRPDLIILDIMMPEMNGFDVAAVLKNDPQTMDIPIIVLSVVQDKLRGYRIGVDRYLTKPIDTTLLFNEIGDLLEQRKSHKKVMVVDEDSGTVSTLTEVLKAKGYTVLESDGQSLVETAISTQPDIIIINTALSSKHDIVKTLRFEKGLENVLFFVYE